MYDVLTLNLAFEVFGLLFCLICILISLLSPKQQHPNMKSQVQFRRCLFAQPLFFPVIRFLLCFRGAILCKQR